jgi:hypothetical protein
MIKKKKNNKKRDHTCIINRERERSHVHAHKHYLKLHLLEFCLHEKLTNACLVKEKKKKKKRDAIAILNDIYICEK